MKLVRILIRAVVLLALASGIYAIWRQQQTEVPRLALGTLERDRITLSATAAEIITQQPVAEGSAVSVGALLVQLDDSLQRATINKVQADLAQQQAQLDKLRNGVRQEEIQAAQARVDTAKTLLKESERDHARIQDIVTRKLAAQAELESAEARRDANASRLRDAQAQLALLEAGSRSEDIRQAEAQLLATEALLAAEQQKLSNLAITATVAGVLDTLPWQVGERVNVGAQVAVLLRAGAPYARVYVPETSRTAVTVGTELTVQVDGVTNPLRGRVRWIANEPAFTPYYALNGSERSRLVYLAEVQLDADANDLPTGLPAQVQLP